MEIDNRLREISDFNGIDFSLMRIDAYRDINSLHDWVQRNGYVYVVDGDLGTSYVRLSDGAFMAGWPLVDGGINFSLWDSFFNESTTLTEFEDNFNRLWSEYEDAHK